MTTPPTRVVPLGRALAVYTGLRVAAFAVCFLLLVLVGLRGLLAIAAALLVSSLAGLFLLRRQRDEVTAALETRREVRAAEQARLRGLLDEDSPGPAGP